MISRFKDFPSDFALDVARGLIPGVTAVKVFGFNPSVGTAFEDVWCSDGTLSYPTIAESWEILSSSANDTSAGSGARTVEIVSLDANYAEQSPVTVIMNGVTPVAISGTHFRPVNNGIRVKTWGATGENEGTLTIRAAGGGATRSCILYDTSGTPSANIGINNTLSSHYTVPAGKTLYLTGVFSNATKDHDISVRLKFRLFGEDGFLTPAIFGIYQNNFNLPLSGISPETTFPEKTDLKYIAKSNNNSVVVLTGLEGYLVDN